MARVHIRHNLIGGGSWPYDERGFPLTKMVPHDGSPIYFVDTLGNELLPPPGFCGPNPIAARDDGPRHVAGSRQAPSTAVRLKVFGSAVPFGQVSNSPFGDGTYRRKFSPGAFRDSLVRDDITLTLGHDGRQLASTRDGSLSVSEMPAVLYFDARIDAPELERHDAVHVSIRWTDIDYHMESWGYGGQVKVTECAQLVHIALLTDEEPAFRTVAYIGRL